ncbi:TPA: hypothetical protein QDB06_000870 [Burkholderia vietnamiensis]|nr:hypothetical protein [Burkholderia vietnamiensis]
MKKTINEIKVAIDTLKNEGLPVTIEQVASLTGFSDQTIRNHRKHFLNDLPLTRPRRNSHINKPAFSPTASNLDRYSTVLKDLFVSGTRMNKQDAADELSAVTGGSVDPATMNQALNSLIANGVLSLDTNGYYRLKEGQHKSGESFVSVLLDEAGNVTVIKAGESALRVAERLISEGARKIIHLVASEVFQPATTIVSHRL